MADDDFKLWEMKKELGLDKWRNISRDVNYFRSVGISKEIGEIGRAFRFLRPISEMGGIGEILAKSDTSILGLSKLLVDNGIIKRV